MISETFTTGYGIFDWQYANGHFYLYKYAGLLGVYESFEKMYEYISAETEKFEREVLQMEYEPDGHVYVNTFTGEGSESREWALDQYNLGYLVAEYNNGTLVREWVFDQE